MPVLSKSSQFERPSPHEAVHPSRLNTIVERTPIYHSRVIKPLSPPSSTQSPTTVAPSIVSRDPLGSILARRRRPDRHLRRRVRRERRVVRASTILDPYGGRLGSLRRSLSSASSPVHTMRVQTVEDLWVIVQFILWVIHLVIQRQRRV